MDNKQKQVAEKLSQAVKRVTANEPVTYDDKSEFLKDALSSTLGNDGKPKAVIKTASGADVDRLTAPQQNTLYAKAQLLKEQIREALLSVSELNNPSAENVQKYLRVEANPEFQKTIQEYRTLMRAINADPNDISTEKLRKQ